LFPAGKIKKEEKGQCNFNERKNRPYDNDDHYLTVRQTAQRQSHSRRHAFANPNKKKTKTTITVANNGQTRKPHTPHKQNVNKQWAWCLKHNERNKQSNPKTVQNIRGNRGLEFLFFGRFKYNFRVTCGQPLKEWMVHKPEPLN